MLQADLTDELERLATAGLLRRIRPVRPLGNARVELCRRTLIDFSSNDYLGLAGTEALARGAARAANEFGASARGSRLVTGTYPLLAALESRLATLKRKEAALVYPTGYMANIGVLGGLASRGDLIVIDRLSHASIVDGARLSRADLRIYPHKDAGALDAMLSRLRGRFRRVLVVTDSLFSVDGDLAPLGEIASVARRHGAITVADDAHGTGVYGADGRGVLEHLGVEDEIDIVVGTLSKALGCQGGFAAADQRVVDLLVNRSRSFIYTTGLAPPICGSALAALEIVETQPQLRRSLWANVRRLARALGNAGVTVGASAGPILPVIVGSAGKALAVSAGLEKEGYLAVAIRPQTVPAGTSRIRLSVSAAHTPGDIDGLVRALLRVLVKPGQ